MSKLYVFVNSYVCGVQVGIQACHAIARLMHEGRADPRVNTWAAEYETFVWLNGGDSERMTEIKHAVDACGISSSTFEEPGMNGLHTATAVVVPWFISDVVDALLQRKPAKIEYTTEGFMVLTDVDDNVESYRTYNLLPSDGELAKLIASCRLKQL